MVGTLKLGSVTRSRTRARAAVGGEVQHGDRVEAVLHHVQGAPLLQQAVAVGQQLAAEVDGGGDAGGRVDPEQQTGVGLDDHERPPVGCAGDPVGVVDRGSMTMSPLSGSRWCVEASRPPCPIRTT